MDILSIIGLILAIAALMGGSVLKGAELSGLWSPGAFVVVILGTIAAILVHVRGHVARRALSIGKWILAPPPDRRQELLGSIVDWSNLVRKQGLLGLEPMIEEQYDPFVRKGMQMLVDGVEPEAIRRILEIDIENREERDIAAAKMFENMGVYAPTLGIIGAVLGLMAVMKNLQDPSKLGHGIAAAFTATIYGIASANLLFLPASAKLKSVIAAQTNERAMLVEGLISIAQGENPRNIETKLSGFLD